MSDFDVVRVWLDNVDASHFQGTDNDPYAALDRIEAEYNKWQDLFADLVDENTRLHGIEGAARDVLGLFDGLLTGPIVDALRTALEGGE